MEEVREKEFDFVSWEFEINHFKEQSFDPDRIVCFF
jgi:hypothetical protein